MLSIAPIELSSQPIPVNPVQYHKVGSVSSRLAPRQVEPLAPVRAISDQPGQNTRHPMERMYLLSVETRRSLLDLDPEHPLNGPHPTD